MYNTLYNMYTKKLKAISKLTSAFLVAVGKILTFYGSACLSLYIITANLEKNPLGRLKNSSEFILWQDKHHLFYFLIKAQNISAK